MDKMYIFQKNGYVFTNKYKKNINHPDGIEHKYEIFLNDICLTNDKIIWYEINSSHFHLGYIGFKEKFQHKDFLKEYIHPHCVKYLMNKHVRKITLKPLVTSFIVWISLGFNLVNKIEELEIKRLILEFLIDKNIFNKNNKQNFNSLSLQEIINKYKKYLLTDDFPPNLEKIYYTYYVKEILRKE